MALCAPSISFIEYRAQALIPSSPIWNETSEQMEMCLYLSLFEPATADDPKMIIAQDKHVFTVGINSTANLDFSFDNALQDSVAGEASSTANLDDYVEACKCTEEEVFECDSSPLAPNEVFHVCVKSSSSDVRINDVTQMVSSLQKVISVFAVQHQFETHPNSILMHPPLITP